jgi:hypothetical protein
MSFFEGLRRLFRKRRCPMCSHLNKTASPGSCVVCGAIWNPPTTMSIKKQEKKK